METIGAGVKSSSSVATAASGGRKNRTALYSEVNQRRTEKKKHAVRSENNGRIERTVGVVVSSREDKKSSKENGDGIGSRRISY